MTDAVCDRCGEEYDLDKVGQYVLCSFDGKEYRPCERGGLCPMCRKSFWKWEDALDKPLKPCPFCGSDNIEIVEGKSLVDGFFCHCFNCNMMTQATDSRESAISRWNRRTNV